MKKRGIAAVAGVVAVVALAIVVAMRLRPGEGESGEGRQAACEGGSGSARSEAEGPRTIEAEPFVERGAKAEVATEALSTGGPRIRGRFVVKAEEGVVLAPKATVRGRLWTRSPAREWGVLPFRPTDPFEAEWTEDVAIGRDFEIAVPHRAHWVVRATVAPAINHVALWTTTEERAAWESTLVEDVDIPVTGAPLGEAYEVVILHLTAESRTIVSAERIADDRWRLTGPLLLPVWTGIRRPEVPSIEWHEVPLRRGALEFPASRVVDRYACVDAFSGRPIPEVHAVFEDRSGLQRHEEGLFSDGVVPHLRDPEQPQTWAIFRARGYAPVSFFLFFSDAGKSFGLCKDDEGRWIVEMLPEGRPGGTVVDALDAPVAGATILATAQGRSSAWLEGLTGGDGRFSLRGRTGGFDFVGSRTAPPDMDGKPAQLLHFVVIERDGTRSILAGVAWAALLAGDWTGMLREARFERALNVTSGGDGGALPRASALLRPRNAYGRAFADLPRADADTTGRIALGAFRDGTWEAEVDAPGHLPRILALGAGDRGEIAVALDRAASLRVRVVDEGDAPLAGRRVVLVPVSSEGAVGEAAPYESRGAATDSEGIATLFVAPAVAHAVSVSLEANEVLVANGPVAFREDGETEVLRVLARRKLRISVEDAAGAKVAAVFVWRVAGETMDYFSELDPDGLDLAPEAVRLTICPAGSHPETVDLDLTKGPPAAPVRIVARAGPRLGGRVVDADGRPIAGAQVEDSVSRCAPLDSYHSNLFRVPATADADGRFAFPHVNPGLHVLLVQLADGQSTYLQCEVTSDADVTIVVK